MYKMLFVLSFVLFNNSTTVLSQSIVGKGKGTKACTAVFKYSGTGNSCGFGKFEIWYEDYSGCIDIPASSGNTWAANNSEYSSWQDIGAIPAGTYRIKLENANKISFRLYPINVPNLGSRFGFLIHDKGDGKTEEESSTGCIILGDSHRYMLRYALDGCGGELILEVSTF